VAAINDIVQSLITWLAAAELAPKPREITSVGTLPAAAYPQIAVLADEEEFSPGDAEVTASLRVRVACAAGRPVEAIASSRELAHQLRAALNQSHNLGGLVKRLRAGGIRYSAPRGDHPAGGVIATAEIELEAKYCVQPLPADNC
jgi:hypothetical protein